MLFRFLALDPAHKVIRGEISASDKIEAEREIINRGLDLQLLQGISEQKNVRLVWWRRILKIGNRHILSSKSKQQFFQEMSILLRSGITVEEALQIVISGYETASIEYNIFKNLLQNVQSGHSLSDAMSMVQQNFSYSEINAVQAAEQVGELGDVMEQLTIAAKNIGAAKNKFGLAMIYPSIVFLVTVFVMVILNVVVIPQFQEIFLSQPGTELPALTRFVVHFCENIGRWTCWIFVFILCLILCQRLPFLYNRGINLREYFLWKLPMIKSLVTDYNLYLFSSILKMLLSCGLSFQQGINSAKNVVFTNNLRKKIDKAIDDINRGDSVSHALSVIFSKLATGIIFAGEQSGKLRDSFNEVADMYYKSLTARLAALSTIIEPILIVFVAIFVGVAVVAIFLPLMNLVSGLKI